MDSRKRDGAWWTAVWTVGPANRVKFVPITLNLDALREVQERLTDEQWHEYVEILRCTPFDGAVNTYPRVLLHATPEQKIRALAAVLRTPEVRP